MHRNCWTVGRLPGITHTRPQAQQLTLARRATAAGMALPVMVPKMLGGEFSCSILHSMRSESSCMQTGRSPPHRAARARAGPRTFHKMQRIFFVSSHNARPSKFGVNSEQNVAGTIERSKTRSSPRPARLGPSISTSGGGERWPVLIHRERRTNNVGWMRVIAERAG